MHVPSTKLTGSIISSSPKSELTNCIGPSHFLGFHSNFLRNLKYWLLNLVG
jgi:hypothetical protein